MAARSSAFDRQPAHAAPICGPHLWPVPPCSEPIHAAVTKLAYAPLGIHCQRARSSLRTPHALRGFSARFDPLSYAPTELADELADPSTVTARGRVRYDRRHAA
jgi:hypothetical protein